MCDQGHIFTFNSKKCETRQESLGRLVATTTKTPHNVYILNEIRKEKSYMGQIDES